MHSASLTCRLIFSPTSVFFLRCQPAQFFNRNEYQHEKISNILLPRTMTIEVIINNCWLGMTCALNVVLANKTKKIAWLCKIWSLLCFYGWNAITIEYGREKTLSKKSAQKVSFFSVLISSSCIFFLERQINFINSWYLREKKILSPKSWKL